MPRTRRKIPRKTLKKTTLHLPILFVLAGIILILIPQAVNSTTLLPTHPSTPAPAKPAKTQTHSPIKIDTSLFAKAQTTQNPQRILIPDYKLDLPIIEAKVIQGVWEVSETTASHGIGSANPGENGNIVVFAHARDDLFGPIRNITMGDEIYLLTKDRWHKYRVIQTKLVDPNDVEVVGKTDKETLTLFTCSGFLDSKRLIVKAQPES